MLMCFQSKLSVIMKSKSITLHGRTFTPQKGMDGPTQYPNGRVVYFDRAEKKYYNPTTDYYIADDEMAFLKGLFLEQLAKDYA